MASQNFIDQRVDGFDNGVRGSQNTPSPPLPHQQFVRDAQPPMAFPNSSQQFFYENRPVQSVAYSSNQLFPRGPNIPQPYLPEI